MFGVAHWARDLAYNRFGRITLKSFEATNVFTNALFVEAVNNEQ
jgi:hypothetical protein